MFIYKYLY